MHSYKHNILAIIISFFLILYLSSCDGQKTLNILKFQPTFHNNKLTCTRSFSQSETQWQYTQLQFFISAIEINSGGQWQKATLVKSPFQTNNIALLGEHCGNTANWQLNFTNNINLATASQIRFTLGLPFAINHLNPLTQDSPLNIPSMFWGWQLGHKFLRLELTADNNNWLFHLGSMGCKASSPLRSPKQECLFPHRYQFQLPVIANHEITVDLSALLNKVILAHGSSCQSAADNKNCQLLFNNLSNGRSFTTSNINDSSQGTSDISND